MTNNKPNEVQRMLEQMAMDSVPRLNLPASTTNSAMIGSVTVGGDMIVFGEASPQALEAILGKRKAGSGRLA